MANPFSTDGWDWPFILYAGKVWLLYSEEELWMLTPRKFQALMDVHYEVLKLRNGSSDNAKTAQTDGFIDTIPGW